MLLLPQVFPSLKNNEFRVPETVHAYYNLAYSLLRTTGPDESG
jgi:hypothetical protein